MDFMMKILAPALAISLVFLTTPAYAYIDPGTAGIILQAIVGGVAAAVAVLANFWSQIKSFFARLFGRGEHKTEHEDESGKQ